MIGAERINLLPGFVASRRRARRILQGSTLVASAAAAAIAVTFLSQGFALRDAKAELDVQLAENAVVAAEVSRLADLDVMRAQLASSQAALTKLFADEVRWSGVMRDIQRILPDETWLTGMSIAVGDFPEGIAQIQFQGTTMRHVDVGNWIQRLGRVETFKRPFFTISSKQQVGNREIVSFSSSVNVTEGARRSATPGAAR